jgi:kynurenine formamidase
MKIIDLSHLIHSNMPVYPGDKEVVISAEKTWESDGYRLSSLISSLHAGTHIDAPSHLTGSDERMNDIDLSRCMGRGVLVDVRNFESIELKHIESLEILEGDIVVFLTGWSKYFGSEKYNNHPALTEELAHFLVTKKINMIAMDMPSCDHEPYPVHKILMNGNILIAENLCNCKELLNCPFEVFAIPLKIEAEASLARVFAVCDEEKTA